MASGITGMSRALDKYGINIRVANLQQELYNLGIDATVSSLSQSDKAILRTITILNSSKYAWADLASTINQPANQVRMLKSNFEALGRSIGTLFLPIVAKVLPYINGLVMALERAFLGSQNYLALSYRIMYLQLEKLQSIWEILQTAQIMLHPGSTMQTTMRRNYKKLFLFFPSMN